MKRFAFKMYLKPGCEQEYERRHAAIWPELVKMIKDGGVSNYSIYWDKDTNILYPEMVGHDGGYHGGESRQLTGHRTHPRSVPSGLTLDLS